MLENEAERSQNVPEQTTQNGEIQPQLELDAVNSASLGLFRLSADVIDSLSACVAETPADMEHLSQIREMIDAFLEGGIGIVTTYPRTPTRKDPPFLPGEHRGIMAKISNKQGYDAFLNMYGGLRDPHSASDLHDNLMAHAGSRIHTTRTDNILSKGSYLNVQIIDPKRDYLANVDLRYQLGNNFRVTKADLYPRTPAFKRLESGVVLPSTSPVFPQLEGEFRQFTSVLTSQVLSAL